MESSTEAQQLSALVQSLEHATFMAKQLPATADPSHLLHIYSSLHQAHTHLSTFLSRTPPPHPPPTLSANSSSATAAAPADEPMEVGDDDDEGNSKSAIDRVEEKMRGCFIRNKRPKRQLSPSAVAVAEEERRLNGEDGFGEMARGFDPLGTRLRALDLVYQFHG